MLILLLQNLCIPSPKNDHFLVINLMILPAVKLFEEVFTVLKHFILINCS